MVKVIHSGDIHLDCAYIGFPSDKAKIRAEEQMESFMKIIETVKSENADIFLLAGDLFENDYVSYKTAEFFKRAFSKIPDTKVFISPGNHDCISGNEIYKNFNLGENVMVFSSKLDYVEIPELSTRVYGYGFENINDEVSINTPLDKNFINILLIHASLPPYADKNKLSKSDIENSGFDYIAAGHIHNHEGFKKYGNTIASYCGVPEGRYFDECGEKGFVVLDISKESISPSFIVNSKRKVHRIEVDVSGCYLSSDIISKLSGLNSDDVYEIFLIGTPEENAFFDIKTISNMLSDKLFFAKVTDRTEKKKTNPSCIPEQKFLEVLKKSGASEDIILRAEKIGLCAFSGEEIK